MPVGAVRLVCVGRDYGWQEQQQGRPFVGPSGKLLTRAMGHAGLDRTAPEVVITNVVNARPARDEWAAHDRSAVLAGLDKLEQLLTLAQPTLIVALGEHALQACTRLDPWFKPPKKHTITETRGYVFESRFGPVLAMVHPAFILRTWHPWWATFCWDWFKCARLLSRTRLLSNENVSQWPSMDQGKPFEKVGLDALPDLREFSMAALLPAAQKPEDSAARCVAQEIQERKPNSEQCSQAWPDQAPQALFGLQKERGNSRASRELQQAIGSNLAVPAMPRGFARAQALAVDIETEGTGVGCKPVCIGFAWTPRIGYALPWCDDCLPTIRALLESDVPKIFHNGQFDVTILERAGCRVARWEHDTMLAWHACEPLLAGKQSDAGSRSEKSLRFLASLLLDEPWWKNYEFATEEEQQVLCARDARITLAVHAALVQRLQGGSDARATLRVRRPAP